MNLNPFNRLLTGLLALLLLTSDPTWADEAQADELIIAHQSMNIDDRLESVALTAAAVLGVSV